MPVLWSIGAYCVACAIAIEPSERTFSASAALIGAATVEGLAVELLVAVRAVAPDLDPLVLVIGVDLAVDLCGLRHHMLLSLAHARRRDAGALVDRCCLLGHCGGDGAVRQH